MDFRNGQTKKKEASDYRHNKNTSIQVFLWVRTGRWANERREARNRRGLAPGFWAQSRERNAFFIAVFEGYRLLRDGIGQDTV